MDSEYNKHSNIKKKKYFDKKLFNSALTIDDRVLSKNLFKREGTGNFRIFWKQVICQVVSCHLEWPIYQIKSENGGNKIRTVHRNLLMKCYELSIENAGQFSTLCSKYKHGK